MSTSCSGLGKHILAAFAAENEAYLDLDTMKRKARAYDILIGASKREIESMWDFMQASGARAEVLIEELERLQRMRGIR